MIANDKTAKIAYARRRWMWVYLPRRNPKMHTPTLYSENVTTDQARTVVHPAAEETAGEEGEDDDWE